MNFQFEFIFTYVTTYLFCALYGLVIIARTTTDIGREMEVRFFKLLVVSLVVYCITESVWAVGNFAQIQAINAFNMPLTVVNSVLVNAVCYFWFCFTESVQHSRLVYDRKWAVVGSLPFLAAVFLSATTPLTGWVFYITPEQTAGRGPLYIVIIVLAYVYAVYATLHNLIGAIRSQTNARRNELLSLTVFAIPPAIVGIIDTLMPTMPIVAPAFFFSMLFVFTMLQESQISHDALTGLNNRRRADRYFDEVRAHASQDNPLLYFIIYGDSFKEVNDTYGHLEGDKALCTIADALRQSCRGTSSFIARWGGDEFVIIAFESDIGRPNALAAHIKNTLRQLCAEREHPYVLSVSVGHARCTNPETHIRDVIAEADRRLYEAKRILRENAARKSKRTAS